jgi:NTE family protein
VKTRLLIISFLWVALFPTGGITQKVGLVLSGGGPRGVTHVGVLKALEENNIPIDFITGTSMGAVVGGLYAAGYSPDEIETLIRSDELISWLSSTLEPEYKHYFKQSSPTASWQLFKIVLDPEIKAHLPTNIVSPFRMDFGFIELFSGSGAAAGYDFDSLFIPFRCVASDIENSRPFVLRNGPVEKAIRASMSFPFYFHPVKIDNRLMFDGGMYNNFPVDVLTSEFKPDVIIGSKAASNYGPPKEDDILSQIQSMLTANTQYEISPDSGVLIAPGLWPVNVTDFSNNGSFIDSGYVATLRQMPNIRKFVKRSETPAEKNKKRAAFRASVPPLKIDDVIFTGISDSKKDYLNRLIRKDKFLEEINCGSLTTEEIFDAIRLRYFAILSDDKVESVYPELTFRDGKYDVIFNVKPSNKLELQVGGLISSQAVNEIYLQLQYKTWGKNALSFTGNTYLGRFHNSGHLNTRFDVPSRIPLSLSLAYTLNGWNYFKTITYFFEDKNPSFLIRRESFGEFEMAIPAGRRSRLVAQFQTGGIRDEYYQDNLFTRLDTADVTRFDFYSPGLIYELNTMNRKQYPSAGSMFRFCGRFISGQEQNIPGSTSIDTTQVSIYHNWIQMRFLYDNYFNLSKIFDLGIYGQAAFSDKQEFNNYISTVMAAPAFEPLPESQTIFLPQFRAHTFFAFGIKGIFHPYKNFDFRSEAYIFQPYREILKTEENKAAFGDPFANQFYIFSGRVVYHAPFGPVSMALNYYDQLEDPFVFNIAIGYYIFNKKSFN